MATRPVFVPRKEGRLVVAEVPVEFTWNPGMAPSQKKKNVAALHTAAKARGLNHLLEISSKSEDEVGRRLSAFSLKLKLEDGTEPYLECAYQGSKVFERGGPFTDLFSAMPRDAKRDPRLTNAGKLTRFKLMGRDYPLCPKNAFYDWLYIRALYPYRSWLSERITYQGFTDIEFNPLRSINCQARAFAELVALANRGELDRSESDFDYFASLLPAI